jgi:predicted ABC-type transport system involved in lysophospholipase L1 biosynthesis ATPase subunit
MHVHREEIEMAIGMVGSGSSALQLVRDAVASKSTQEAIQVEVAGKALDIMRAEGEAAVRLINSAAPHLGQHVNVRA